MFREKKRTNPCENVQRAHKGLYTVVIGKVFDDDIIDLAREGLENDCFVLNNEKDVAGRGVDLSLADFEQFRRHHENLARKIEFPGNPFPQLSPNFVLEFRSEESWRNSHAIKEFSLRKSKFNAYFICFHSESKLL